MGASTDPTEPLTPTVERFRALARSSPWRFATLRFSFTRRGHRDGELVVHEPVRAWLRRPGQLRVEDAEGRIRIHEGRPYSQGVVYQWGPRRRRLPWRSRVRAREVPLRWPQDVEPRLDADGLVAVRPHGRVGYDDPLHGSFDWVAMLDPVELAGDVIPPGEPVPAEVAAQRDPFELRYDEPDPERVAVAIEDVVEVDHHGRPAWEARVRARDGYAPRCECCALLAGEHLDELLQEAGADHLVDGEVVHPDHHRVRLDVGTGVCVLNEQVGGDHDRAGHETVIEAVDEPMPDGWFQTPGRRSGRARRATVRRRR